MLVDKQKMERDVAYLLVAAGMAIGWLLPNHYAPWNTFHTNAWIGFGLLVVVLVTLLRQRIAIVVTTPAVFLFGLVAVPPLQYFFGLIALPSHATVSAFYLVGLLAAFVLGESWGRRSEHAPVGLVMGASAVAGIFSVGLQLYQWFGWAVDPALEDFWIFPFSGDGRPYANLGQPNQLASLQLWALCGLLWLLDRQLVRAWVALAAAVFVLIGVALTESRTALLTLTAMTVWVAVYGRPLLGRELQRACIGLYLFYGIALVTLPVIGQWLDLGVTSSLIQRSAGEIRINLWKMALLASLEHPLAGFGWGQSHAGFFIVYPQFEEFAGRYAEQSHNLVLDLALWVGWPLALLITLIGCYWLWRVAHGVDSRLRLVVVAALAVMLVHALLELPLHHGYFLWPAGLLAGVANIRGGWRTLSVWPFKAVIPIGAALLVSAMAIVSDYLKVEAAFYELRFHLQRIGVSDAPMKLQTLVLSDWPDFIAMSRAVPSVGMSEAAIKQWHDLLIYNTSALAYRKYIGALVLNGRIEEARYWERRACFVLNKPKCNQMIDEWIKSAAVTVTAIPGAALPVSERSSHSYLPASPLTEPR